MFKKDGSKIIKIVNLYFKQRTSDKEYNLELSRTIKNEHVVSIKYGRRGNLNEYTTFAKTIDLEEAERHMNRQINKKLAKGYQYDEETVNNF